MSTNKILFGVCALVIAGVLFFVYDRPRVEAPTVPVATTLPADVVSLSIAPGANVSHGQVVTGVLRGGYFFEANARGMILDAQKNVLASFPIAATTDWMTAGEVSFTTTLSVPATAHGAGYFRIANDNPSGDTVNDKFSDVSVSF
jgi:hypothetical protein